MTDSLMSLISTLLSASTLYVVLRVAFSAGEFKASVLARLRRIEEQLDIEPGGD